MVNSSAKNYSLKVVTKKTGLTTHTIRAWERRYDAVSPERDHNNRRLYSEDDIKRLILLKRATDQGFSISHVIKYSNAEIESLIGTPGLDNTPENQVTELSTADKIDSQVNGYSRYIDSFFESLEIMDIQELESILIRASTEFGTVAFVEHVAAPIMDRIGQQWINGELRVSHEHVASHAIKTFLSNLLVLDKPVPGAPVIVFATPSDQWHDLGAIMAAITAVSEGWNPVYLGANLPADEIAGAAINKNALAVGISIVYPPNNPFVVAELRNLRRFLPNNISIITGGQAAVSYKSVLEEINAYRVSDLKELRSVLKSIMSDMASDK